MLQRRRRVVITLHGIESEGAWEMDLAPLISEQGWVYYPLHYGRFRLDQFLNPSERKKKVRWFRDKYNYICNRQGQDVRPSVIAHSFGTYIVANALTTYEGIKLDNLIVCGSILPRNFNWERLSSRGQVTKVRNDYGQKDLWARVARFVPGMGNSGERGFTTKHHSLVDEEFEKYTHSAFFGYDHYQTYWIPFLKEHGLGNEVEAQDKASEFDQRRSIRIITNAQELIQENMSIVNSATKTLACAGSRSRDANYLQAIEEKLVSNPRLIHYRILFG